MPHTDSPDYDSDVPLRSICRGEGGEGSFLIRLYPGLQCVPVTA